MADLVKECEIERCIHGVMEAEGWNDPYGVYEQYEDIRTAVEQEMAQAALGQSTPYRLLVIPYDVDRLPGEPYGWHFRAVEPEAGLQGCLHEVAGVSRQAARVEAVCVHRMGHNCQVWG